MGRRKNKAVCRRCKRPLTDKKSLKLGFGPICFEKQQKMVMQRLEEAGQMRLPGIYELRD